MRSESTSALGQPRLTKANDPLAGSLMRDTASLPGVLVEGSNTLLVRPRFHVRWRSFVIADAALERQARVGDHKRGARATGHAIPSLALRGSSGASPPPAQIPRQHLVEVVAAR